MKVVNNLPIKRFLSGIGSSITDKSQILFKKSLIVFHLVLVIIVASFIFISSQRDVGASQSLIKRTVDAEASAVIDAVASAEIAASVAKTSNLSIKDSVANQADSLSAQVDFATVNDSYLAKPQVIATDIKTKNDIITYTTVDGDTVGSLAAKFNITSDTIRWANNLTGDKLTAGKQLTILPINGVIHEVKSGDTVESIADKYRASKEQLIFFNDIELSGIKNGDKIIVPGGAVQTVSARRISGMSPTVASGFSFGSGPLYGGNGYTYGYCTWHAANRRIAIGRELPRNLGNAITWYSLAQRAGIPVGNIPQAGAVLWHRDRSAGYGLGHVAFVEGVNSDGSILVSDMNYTAGWNRISYRTIPPSEFGSYGFIY